MNRRHFLKSSLGYAGSLGFGSLISQLLHRNVAYASPLQANLLVIRLHGAMDCVAGINPWVTQLPPRADLFVTYDPSRPGIAGENTVLKKVNGTEIDLGPAAHNLAPFADRMAIVKGIWMGPADIGHPFAMHYMSSGHSQEKAPHSCAVVADARKEQDQFLILNSPIEHGSMQVKIMQTLSLKNGFGTSQADVDKYISLYKSNQAHFTSYRTLSKNHDKTEAFNQYLKEISSAATYSDEDVVVAAMAAGLSTVAQVDIQAGDGGNVDNHIQYESDHTKNQKNRWDRVAKTLENLKKFNLLDKTLVVVLTEFSRTAALNTNLGKDHNYLDNAMALFGYGIKGGSTIGGHSVFGVNSARDISQLSGQFIDYESGEVFKTANRHEMNDESKLPEGIDLIRPANALETVLRIVLPDVPSVFGANTKTLSKIIAGS